MLKFPSITEFKTEYDSIISRCKYHGIKYPTINYTGTVKLHGTGSGIHVCPSGDVIAQSRRRELTIDRDNYGWANKVYMCADAINNFALNMFGKNNDLYIFGEYIGNRIERAVAISHMSVREFVIFAININNKWIENRIEYQLPDYNIRNILEAPTYDVSIDYSNPSIALDKIKTITEQVERECPWGILHGISGTGEGVVWKSTDGSSSIFKTKGMQHKGGKHATITTPTVDAGDYVELLATILPLWRLEQGVEFLIENNMDLSIKHVGKYLKFINMDILKEDTDIIINFNKPWNEIARRVNEQAKQYFYTICNTI